MRDFLAGRGASFFDELAAGAGLLPTHAEAALGELVARGLVSSDSFSGLRALLRPARKRPPVRSQGGKPTFSVGTPQGAGRWSLLRQPVSTVLNATTPDATAPDATAPDAPMADSPPLHDPAVEAFAWVLLRRYGVVYRRLLEREGRAPPWRELLRVYRRLEARGEIRGGRFVGGMAGEQYALPEAVGSLREVRRRERTGHLVSLSAADPLNLSGILTPGRRVPALTANRVLYRDGVPCATQEGGQVHFLEPVPPGEEWLLKKALAGHPRTGLMDGVHPTEPKDGAAPPTQPRLLV